ncbi:unnamed protein product [Gongylonema pulchrum]|uniref:Uncharacterized protein n=1 Tax=Gongylonema pulchrum TaxID=637853 RepID=A0A3P7MPN0_9BILA|nr:unnamed protein product [Gongylonema pulchrum]
MVINKEEGEKEGDDSEELDEDEYEVERILDVDAVDGQVKYKGKKKRQRDESSESAGPVKSRKGSRAAKRTRKESSDDEKSGADDASFEKETTPKRRSSRRSTATAVAVKSEPVTRPSRRRNLEEKKEFSKEVTPKKTKNAWLYEAEDSDSSHTSKSNETDLDKTATMEQKNDEKSEILSKVQYHHSDSDESVKEEKAVKQVRGTHLDKTATMEQKNDEKSEILSKVQCHHSDSDESVKEEKAVKQVRGTHRKLAVSI